MDKGDGKVKYVLSGEGATSIFTIDENTGDIHATKRLDREAQAYYTLQAQAVDRLTNIPVEPRSEFVVKVQDINDNEPKFLDGPYLAGVPEMSPLGKTRHLSWKESVNLFPVPFPPSFSPRTRTFSFTRPHLSVFEDFRPLWLPSLTPGHEGCWEIHNIYLNLESFLWRTQ